MPQCSVVLQHCDACGEEIEGGIDHYECDVCRGFAMCASCFEQCAEGEDATERHVHPLHRVRGALVPRALLSHSDSETGRSVVLTNCAGVLPGSPLLFSEGGTVRAVLSLLDLSQGDDDGQDEQTPLLPEEQALCDFAYAAGATDLSVRGGCVYYYVRLQDVSSPGMLQKVDLANSVAGATLFVTRALEKMPGDVAVHCYLGKRRSPTVLAAWMVTRKSTVDAALNEIGENHAEVGEWAEEFRRLRPGWVEWLHWWRTSWKVQQNRWASDNADRIAAWDSAFTRALDPTSGREPPKDDSAEEEIPVVAKRRRLKKAKLTQVVDDDDNDGGDCKGDPNAPSSGAEGGAVQNAVNSDVAGSPPAKKRENAKDANSSDAAQQSPPSAVQKKDTKKQTGQKKQTTLAGFFAPKK